MKSCDLRLVSDILRAIDDLKDVRAGLKVKPSHDDPVVLELGAYEGDHDGGTGHGSALLPLAVADRVVNAAETALRDELERLAVNLEK